jgi:hypothetical protein
MSFITSLFAKCIMTILRVKEDDYRDWDAIQTWAKGIHSKLLAQRASLMT